MFTRLFCGLAAPFHRSLSNSNSVLQRPSRALCPRRRGISVSRDSATIDSAEFVVKGHFPGIVSLSWHAREGRESDPDSFHGSL